jgi:hypothetical protein
MEAIASSYMPLSYVYAARYGEGRTTVPVISSQAIYANFQNVSGFAAQDGVAAYSIDKLQILNALIGSLRAVKSEPLAASEASPSLDEKRIDALIQQYGAELHAAATAPALPYTAAASSAIASPGSLFAMAA